MVVQITSIETFQLVEPTNLVCMRPHREIALDGALHDRQIRGERRPRERLEDEALARFVHLVVEKRQTPAAEQLLHMRRHGSFTITTLGSMNRAAASGPATTTVGRPSTCDRKMRPCRAIRCSMKRKGFLANESVSPRSGMPLRPGGNWSAVGVELMMSVRAKKLSAVWNARRSRLFPGDWEQAVRRNCRPAPKLCRTSMSPINRIDTGLFQAHIRA
jgi:hypothetical protein